MVSAVLLDAHLERELDTHINLRNVRYIALVVDNFHMQECACEFAARPRVMLGKIEKSSLEVRLINQRGPPKYFGNPAED